MAAAATARTVLLTGASGVVGRAVAEELADSRVIGLVHRDTHVPAVDEVLEGDLAMPRLGLSETRWRELAREVDVIVHSGALTEWGQPRERHRAINVGGTSEIVELAAAAGAPVHLVSTAFVHAIERGALGDLSPDNVVIPYITSKLEAERVVAESGIPHSVFRSTNLVGDSRTGASSAPQIVQRVSAWICRGKAPYFPAHPGNVVDAVPVDVIGIAIARAVETDDLGRLYWVTYGPHAMTVPETIEIAVEHARSRGRDIAAPPVVDPDEPLPIPLERIPPRSRRYVKLLIDMSEVIRGSGGVLPTSIDELRTRLGVPMPSDRDAYRASLEYWADEARAARDTSEMAQAA